MRGSDSEARFAGAARAEEGHDGVGFDPAGEGGRFVLRATTNDVTGAGRFPSSARAVSQSALGAGETQADNRVDPRSVLPSALRSSRVSGSSSISTAPVWSQTAPRWSSDRPC